MPSERPVPELLRERSERQLRAVLRAIVRAHPDEVDRTEEMRVSQALAILLGRSSPMGPTGKNRDELLEMLAFEYSVETEWHKRNVSPTSVAEKLVDFHPDTASDATKPSIVRDLVRKFEAHREELLAAHSFNGSEDPDVIYEPIVAALNALMELGVAVDKSVLPPRFRGRLVGT